MMSSEAESRPQVWAIAAMDETRAIGRDNDIPWRIPGEQLRFKELTMGQVVILGRRTYVSIGRPLPGRTIVVLTRSASFSAEGVRVAHSPSQAMAMALAEAPERVCIGGGEEIYKMFLPETDRVYLTQVHASYGGDRHFPELRDMFDLRSAERVEGTVPYSYLMYERRPSSTVG